jgi:hypothetical protein
MIEQNNLDQQLLETLVQIDYLYDVENGYLQESENIDDELSESLIAEAAVEAYIINELIEEGAIESLSELEILYPVIHESILPLRKENKLQKTLELLKKIPAKNKEKLKEILDFLKKKVLRRKSTTQQIKDELKQHFKSGINAWKADLNEFMYSTGLKKKPLLRRIKEKLTRLGK